MLLGRDREDGSPLKLRRGMRLLLLRNELASWLAEEMLLVVVGFAGGSQASLASLRPCSHGATLVVMSCIQSVVVGGCFHVSIIVGPSPVVCNGKGVRNMRLALLDRVE